MLTLYWSDCDSANLGPEQRRVWRGDRARIVADRAHVGVRDGGAVWRWYGWKPIRRRASHLYHPTLLATPSPSTGLLLLRQLRPTPLPVCSHCRQLRPTPLPVCSHCRQPRPIPLPHRPPDHVLLLLLVLLLQV